MQLDRFPGIILAVYLNLATLGVLLVRESHANHDQYLGVYSLFLLWRSRHVHAIPTSTVYQLSDNYTHMGCNKHIWHGLGHYYIVKNNKRMLMADQ